MIQCTNKMISKSTILKHVLGCIFENNNVILDFVSISQKIEFNIYMKRQKKGIVGLHLLFDLFSSL